MQFIQARPENFHGLRFVFVLRAFVLALHDEARRQMRQAHGRVGFIDMLPARAARAIRIDSQIVFVHGNIDIVGHFRDHHDRRKRRMPAFVGVERRHAD